VTVRELTAESALLLDRLIQDYEVAVAQERNRMDALDQEAVDGEAATAVEGARTRVEVNRYERDPGVRLAAIQIHGTRRQVCGFSFAEVYGERGTDYIEIHHPKPLSSRPE
jgi:5-methylcytosine-specific restriction protein A